MNNKPNATQFFLFFRNRHVLFFYIYKKVVLFLVVPLVMGVFTAKNAFCHPHVFIDNYINVVFDKKGVSGFELNWFFDEMTSAGFIMDYDTNRDGKIDKQEAQVFKKEAFDNLKNSHYMTHISINRKKFLVKYVKDFVPLISDTRLVYRFSIPCHVTATKNYKAIHISVYDDEYFINFTTREKKIRLINEKAFDYSISFETNQDESFYFGQFNPKELILKFKKK